IERPPDAEERAWIEDDVRQCSVRRHDRRAARGDEPVWRWVPSARARVKHPCQKPGRVVADQRARLDPERLERKRLMLRVLGHAAPERPRIRHYDPDLHPAPDYALPQLRIDTAVLLQPALRRPVPERHLPALEVPLDERRLLDPQGEDP